MRLLRDSVHIIWLLLLIVCFATSTLAQRFPSNFMYAARWIDKDSVNCAKDGAGIRTDYKGLYCYIFVNKKILLSTNADDIKFSELHFLEGETTSAGETTIEISESGLATPGTVIKAYYKSLGPKTLGKDGRIWISFKNAKDVLFGVGVKSDGQLIVNDEFNSTSSRYPNRKVEQFGGVIEIFIVIMNHFAKVFVNGKHITDFPFFRSYTEGWKLVYTGSVTPNSFMSGKLPGVVNGIGAAEEYCRNNFFGHLFTPRDKGEKDLVESEVFTTDSKFSLFVPLGINSTTQPNNFEGENSRYVMDSVKQKFDKTNDCVSWVRLFSRTGRGSWERKDVMELYKCQEPLVSFICRSKLPKDFKPTKEVLPQLAGPPEAGIGEKDLIILVLAGLGLLSALVMIGTTLCSGPSKKKKSSGVSFPRDGSLSPPIYDTPVFEYNDRDDFDSN